MLLELSAKSTNKHPYNCDECHYFSSEKKTKKVLKKTHQKTIHPYNKVPLYILPGIKVCFLYILCKSMYLRSSACIKNHVFDEFIVLNDV